MKIIFNKTIKDFQTYGQRLIRHTFIAPIIIIEEDVIPSGSIRIECISGDSKVVTVINNGNEWEWTELRTRQTKIEP